MMAVFFFIANKKGYKFHAQPQTGAYFFQVGIMVIILKLKCIS